MVEHEPERPDQTAREGCLDGAPADATTVRVTRRRLLQVWARRVSAAGLLGAAAAVGSVATASLASADSPASGPQPVVRQLLVTVRSTETAINSLAPAKSARESAGEEGLRQPPSGEGHPGEDRQVPADEVEAGPGAGFGRRHQTHRTRCEPSG